MIKNLNYILILITMAILGAIGLIFIAGAGYSWVQSIQMSDWQRTSLYYDYITAMNLGVAPLSILLVIVLGLCIPKRLFSGATLLQLMGVLLFLTLAAAALVGPMWGIAFLLAAAGLIQVVVIALTLAGSKQLSYESRSFLVQIGSALLHLGFVIFLFNFVVLSASESHISVFWLATVLIGIGMILSFYSAELSGLGQRLGLTKR
jgi:hypothetical protein